MTPPSTNHDAASSTGPSAAKGPGLRAYLAAPEREAELSDELRHAGVKNLEQHGRLFLATGGPRHAAWASNVWLEAERFSITSIRNATESLAARQKHWCLFSQNHHRRATLIQEGLPTFASSPLHFGDKLPNAPFGSWTLLDESTLLVSARCSSRFPDGEVTFVPDRNAPPSRAYLKLWELFTITGRKPRRGELCLDLGSSPGGWTWVLAKLGARVISVDKAPVAPHIAALPGVRVLQQSAFALDPTSHPKVDWLFSDVICYPDRLLEHIQRWLTAGTATNFVCTLKFQGQTDHDVVRQFAKIPGSRLAHLHHNKHELTWWKFAS